MKTAKPEGTAPTREAGGDAAGQTRYRLFWLTLAGLLVADQLTKALVLLYIPERTYHDPPPIPVIDGFFYLVHIWNPGAAWGILPGQTIWLTLLAVVALATLYWFRDELGIGQSRLMQVTFGMLCGGIIGNFIDRIWLQHVIDFLDFHLPLYGRFPAFNLADVGITLGVVVYLLSSLRELLPAKARPGSRGDSAKS